MVVRNAAEAVSPPAPEVHEIKPLTVDEAKRFLKVLETDRLDAYFVIICTTGIRKSEGLALQTSRLNLDAGTVTIRRSPAQIYGKGLVLGEPKSQKSKRELALPDFTVKVLRSHLETYSKHSDFVFSTGIGIPFSPRNILRLFKTKLEEAGLPESTRIHDLRNSYISWLLKIRFECA